MDAAVLVHHAALGIRRHPGHPEVELALIRLYRITGEPAYRALAEHFVDARGTDDYFVRERLEAIIQDEDLTRYIL